MEVEQGEQGGSKGGMVTLSHPAPRSAVPSADSEQNIQVEPKEQGEPIHHGCVTSADLRRWVTTHCSSALWSLERGADGYLHWQIHLTLLKKNRFSWLKNHFSTNAHIEKSRAIDKAMAYAVKADHTLVAGPFRFPETLKHNITDPLHGLTPYWWQQDIINICKGEPHDRIIHWYWEPEGQTGKSALCKHLAIHHNAFVVQGAGKDILHGITKTT